MTTPRISMPEILSSQAQKEVAHNDALRIIDALLQAGVTDRDLTAPPGSPANGTVYIPAATATGAWAGQEGKLAQWYASAWHFLTPAEGWVVWVIDEQTRLTYQGGNWTQTTAKPAFPTQAKPADYTVTSTDAGTVLLVDTSAGSVIITLPAAATAGNGFALGVLKSTLDSNIVTIAPAAGETVDFEAEQLLTVQGEGTLIVSDGGANWVGVGGGGSGSGEAQSREILLDENYGLLMSDDFNVLETL
jgi:hypothetical protein